ncbi:MAG: aminoglycoside 6-adenylyltransferase [Enterococcus sp.]|uniref:aminoglycoside 6-adenylyltransferase n=1 Tax=Enterococcus sp. TaxID=35783 RepID=UPI0039948405
MLDKTGEALRLIPHKFNGPPLLDHGRGLRLWRTFWFLAIYLAKQIVRQELWTVKLRDAECKQVLLQTIEWYEKMVHSENYDTWHAGPLSMNG